MNADAESPTTKTKRRVRDPELRRENNSTPPRSPRLCVDQHARMTCSRGHGCARSPSSPSRFTFHVSPGNIGLSQYGELMPLEHLLGHVVVFHAQADHGLAVG